MWDGIAGGRGDGGWDGEGIVRVRCGIEMGCWDLAYVSASESNTLQNGELEGSDQSSTLVFVAGSRSNSPIHTSTPNPSRYL